MCSAGRHGKYFAITISTLALFAMWHAVILPQYLRTVKPRERGLGQKASPRLTCDSVSCVTRQLCNRILRIPRPCPSEFLLARQVTNLRLKRTGLSYVPFIHLSFASPSCSSVGTFPFSIFFT